MVTPNINRILRADPRSGKYGAPMGASNRAGHPRGKLYCQRVQFIDGDYGADGTYWGGNSPLYCVFDAENTTRWYVRASSRREALAAFYAEGV